MTAEPIPVMDLIRKTLRQIDAHPETWIQALMATPTEFGTACCVAGWGCILSGHIITFDEYDEPIIDNEPCASLWQCAVREFGITADEADELFYFRNSRKDIERIALGIAKRANQPLWPTEETKCSS